MSVKCPFQGIPPVQSKKSPAFVISPSVSYNYELIVSFCKKMTITELIAAAPTTTSNAAAVIKECSKTKLPQGAATQVLGLISNPKGGDSSNPEGDCNTVLQDYPSKPAASSAKKVYLEQAGDGTEGSGSLVEFDFKCDPSAKDWVYDATSSKPDLKPPQNAYNVQATWAGGCPGYDFGGGASKKSSGGAFGIAIIVILLVGIVLYIAGMVGYNKFVKKAEGRDLAPHPDFWTKVPSYLKDGHMFVINKVKGRGSSEYSSV